MKSEIKSIQNFGVVKENSEYISEKLNNRVFTEKD